MKILYDKFKINNYIFLISHIKIPSYKKKNMENFDMNSEVERFVSKFNYIMYRDNSFYQDNMTLTTIFFIKDRKMRMRTGHSLRNIIKDKDALNILNRRINDLREEKYYEVIYGLVNDVYKTYISNYELYNSFLYKNSNKIVYTIISIIIGIIFFWNIISYVPESERENKIKEFLNRNKDKKIKKIFNESCIICLEYFMPEEDKLKIENLFDKKKLKQEKTTFLECGHQFHERCIIEWLKTQNKCPLCRIKVKYENDKNKQNRESYINDNNDDERSRFLGFDNFFSVDDIVNDIVYIQRDAYPHQINEFQRNRIISDCNKDKNEKCSSDNDNDFDSFNDGSGGATSDW